MASMATHEHTSESQLEHERMLREGTQLPHWEDEIASCLAEQCGINIDELGSWEARPPLGDILRPDDFNGSLVDIRIVPLTAPHEELVSTASAAGKRSFARGSETLSAVAASKIDPAQVRGSLLAATASSTKQPRIDDIYAQVWYVLRPISKLGTETADVIRYVSAPVTDTSRFDALLARSIAAGRNVLSVFAAHPIHAGGMGLSVRPRKLDHDNRSGR